jgi:hypothetical protein
VTVEGGKFTTSRMLAEKTVDIAERKLARRRIDSPTASRYLWGCQIPDMRDFTLRLFRDNRDFDWDTLEYLGRNYGTETDEVLALARTDRRLRERLDRDGEIAAQVVHAVRNEMARTLEDIVLRRTGIGSLGEAGGDTLEETAQAAASELGWDRERICAEVEGCGGCWPCPASEAREDIGMFKGKVVPRWFESAPPKGSWRSLFKYGNPYEFKHPSSKWVEMIRREFEMTDEDFASRRDFGLTPSRWTRRPCSMRCNRERLEAIVGAGNVACDDYSRARYASGKTTEEMLELRSGIVPSPADLVVHPRSKKDVQEILAYCNAHGIPVYTYGGGSSVTFGLRPERGGVTLVLGTHMNRVLSISELNQTARVQPGLYGPAFEEALNRAPELFHTRRRYTCGHFPQSFEYSTVGGWIVTLGSGQASSYYGDACHLVVSQEYVTPSGTIKTRDFPAEAQAQS